MIKNLSANLKQLMSIKGVAVSALSEDLDIPQSNIYRILRGETQKPKKNNVRKIAQHFNITYDEIIGQLDINWGSVEGWLEMLFTASQRLSLCLWELGERNRLREITSAKKIVTTYSVSGNAFALQIHDRTLEMFPFNSIIVCDPEQQPIHGSHVLVKLNNSKKLYLRKLLEDINGSFLKPLDKNFNGGNIYKMDENTNVFATVVHLQYDLFEK